MKTKAKINTLNKTMLSISNFLLVLLLLFAFNAKASASGFDSDQVIKLTNESRAKENMPALKEDKKLSKAAEEKAQDMFDKNYFAHISPTGKTPWDFIAAEGYNYRFAGENLAINFTDAKEQEKAWMESPLHRKNILSPDYQEIGVAVKSGIIDGHKTIVTVQEFGTKMKPEALALVNGSMDQKPQQQIADKKNPVTNPVASNAAIARKENLNTKQNWQEKIMPQIENGKIIQDKRITLVGWILIFLITLVASLSDMLVVLHAKNRRNLELSNPGKFL